MLVTPPFYSHKDVVQLRVLLSESQRILRHTFAFVSVICVFDISITIDLCFDDINSNWVS